jgi:hypothetical protein
MLSETGWGDAMAVTMKDVAPRACVSIKTVSRVVNNQGEVSDETRQRLDGVILNSIPSNRTTATSSISAAWVSL